MRLESLQMDRARSMFGLICAAIGLVCTVAAVYLDWTHQQSPELPSLESFGPLLILIGLFVWWYYRKDRNWPGRGVGPRLR